MKFYIKKLNTKKFSFFMLKSKTTQKLPKNYPKIKQNYPKGWDNFYFS